MEWKEQMVKSVTGCCRFGIHERRDHWEVFVLPSGCADGNDYADGEWKGILFKNQVISGEH